jgi:hypothetical protein
MIEGSEFGSVSLTNESGSGSWRPKNIWILRIRIRTTANRYPETDFSLNGSFRPDCTGLKLQGYGPCGCIIFVSWTRIRIKDKIQKFERLKKSPRGPWMLTVEARWIKMKPCRVKNQRAGSHILMRSSIRIHIKVKSWIRIRIKMN